MRERRAHLRAREHGVLRPLHAFARALLTPFFLLWFRVRISGAEHIPARGPAIIAPNHKSFLDPFLVGLATRRDLRYMAKAELFRGPLAWLFVGLGAFPVRRGEADADAIETSRAILADGGLVVVFAEGTRVDVADALGSPHHGAGRLALETGAPIIPAAISGTSNLFLGPFPKPKRVRIAFVAPVEVSDLGAEATREALSELVDRRVWPEVRAEYGRLLSTPGLIAAGLTAIGVGGGLIARRQRKRSRGVRLVGTVAPPGLRRRRRRRELWRRAQFWNR